MTNILVVDDDLVILATLSMGLQRAGYRVLQADNGQAALQLDRTVRPDLAILDMRMPGMSGLDVAKAISETTRTPFIFLSAFNDDAIVREAVEAGALGYLVKPVEIARIVPSIEVALARADELSALEKQKANLAEALDSSREIDVAIGLLMERKRIDRAGAFGLMRSYARSQRCKVAEVAQRLVAGERIEF